MAPLSSPLLHLSQPLLFSAHPPSLTSCVPRSPLLLASSLFHFTFSLSHSSQTSFDQSDSHQLSDRFSSSLALTNNKSSVNSLTRERGRYLSPGSGIRASRSYDLLTDAIHDDFTDRGDVFSSSFHGRDNSPFMSYGISPRLYILLIIVVMWLLTNQVSPQKSHVIYTYTCKLKELESCDFDQSGFSTEVTCHIYLYM